MENVNTVVEIVVMLRMQSTRETTIITMVIRCEWNFLEEAARAEALVLVVDAV
jgi:hypothetical protein